MTEQLISRKYWKIYWKYGGLFRKKEIENMEDAEKFAICDYLLRVEERYYKVI